MMCIEIVVAVLKKKYKMVNMSCIDFVYASACTDLIELQYVLC